MGQPLPLTGSMAPLPLLSCNELLGVGPVLVYLWISCTLQGGLSEKVEGRSVKSDDLD